MHQFGTPLIAFLPIICEGKIPLPPSFKYVNPIPAFEAQMHNRKRKRCAKNGSHFS